MENIQLVLNDNNDKMDVLVSHKKISELLN